LSINQTKGPPRTPTLHIVRQVGIVGQDINTNAEKSTPMFKIGGPKPQHTDLKKINLTLHMITTQDVLGTGACIKPLRVMLGIVRVHETNASLEITTNPLITAC
jgi:hypothetical protein